MAIAVLKSRLEIDPNLPSQKNICEAVELAVAITGNFEPEYDWDPKFDAVSAVLSRTFMHRGSLPDEIALGISSGRPRLSPIVFRAIASMLLYCAVVTVGMLYLPPVPALILYLAFGILLAYPMFLQLYWSPFPCELFDLSPEGRGEFILKQAIAKISGAESVMSKNVH